MKVFHRPKEHDFGHLGQMLWNISEYYSVVFGYILRHEVDEDTTSTRYHRRPQPAVFHRAGGGGGEIWGVGIQMYPGQDNLSRKPSEKN